MNRGAKDRRITRRSFLGQASATLAPLALPGAASWAETAPWKGAIARTAAGGGPRSGGRIVILGFDGVEPGIIDAMLQMNKLPNMAALQARGGYQRLLSSNPPQSPTAWSSFATCTRPGNHGIYDFLRRNPETYLPGLGFGAMKGPQLAADGQLVRPAEYVSYRKGDTFWSFADRNGVRCRLLKVPYAYPPEPLVHGTMLCGLDVPDIRGTQSTFFALSEDMDEEKPVGGGVRLPLKFDGNTAIVQIPGLRHPSDKQFVLVPVKITADRERKSIAFEVQGQNFTVSEHAWSDWVEWTFQVTPQFAVRAISRIHVRQMAPTVEIYMTCLQVHPKAPYLPLSVPADYAGHVADRHGLFKTVGWSDDTKGLEQEVLGEEEFLEEAWRTMAWQETLALDEISASNFDLLLAGWTSTDRIAHMFWRYQETGHPKYDELGAKRFGRAISDTYGKMDQIVGKVAAALNEDDLLIVMSDHGFHGFRRAFSLNTWLVRNGYLSVEGQRDASSAFTDEKYLQGYDWSNTRAYGLGLGSIFLNLNGREGKGTVSNREAPTLLAEMKSRLLSVTDPQTGKPVFGAVYTRDEIYRGDSENNAPDIQLGYLDGYQTDKTSAAGAAPAEVFSTNDDKWSGDHAASDVASSHGILFSSCPLQTNAAIIDLGVTALGYLGLDAPTTFEGKSLLRGTVT